MCINQHSCCAPCMQELLKKDSVKQINCPHCHLPINKKTVTKNRLLLLIYEIVDAFKSQISMLNE